MLAAIKAVEAGVSGIVVSNHGARQLDYARATISVLEEVLLHCLETPALITYIHVHIYIYACIHKYLYISWTRKFILTHCRWS